MEQLLWVVEFKVDKKWVKDGFNLNESRALDMLETALPFAYGSELGARILKSPAPAVIRKLQK